MKQLLITIFSMFLPLMAIADAVEYKGIYYNLITKGEAAEVTTNPNGYSGDIVIPETIEYDGIEYSVTTIGYINSQEHNKVTSVSIPKTVTTIKSGALYIYDLIIYIEDMEAWCNIDIDYWMQRPFANFRLFLNGIEVKELVIPEITELKIAAFLGCTSLTSVTIPNSVTKIGSSAFCNCTSLSSVSIPNSVTNIDYGAFQNCTSLTSATIPKGVTSIGAFSGCTSLSSVIIPNSVTSIDYGAFRDCSSLTSVSIPNSVVDIGREAFRLCTGLTSVTIPEKVTIIDSYAFWGCSGITSVSLGSGLKQIKDEVFANCKELTDVYCLAEDIPRTGIDVFKNSYIEYATLHVPSSAINTYKNTAPWSGFKEIVPLSGESIPKCATPTISLENGKIVFGCETEGVEYVSSITVPDAKDYYDGKLTLSYKYKVTVYATKAGYDNSDTATREIVITENGKAILVGDVDGDGKVNVADHVKLSEIIMSPK